MINGLHAVGRKAQRVGYDGPALGPAESSENKREFTEEQLMVSKMRPYTLPPPVVDGWAGAVW